MCPFPKKSEVLQKSLAFFSLYLGNPSGYLQQSLTLYRLMKSSNRNTTQHYRHFVDHRYHQRSITVAKSPIYASLHPSQAKKFRPVAAVSLLNYPKIEIWDPKMMTVTSGEALQVAFSKRTEARITYYCLSLVTCHVINVSSLYQAGEQLCK